jgi:uncharacterized cupin superfamily protein
MPKIDLGARPVTQGQASYLTAFGKKTNLFQAIKIGHDVDLNQFGVAIDAVARHIKKGMRSEYDRAHYPDIDLKYYRGASGRRFTNKDSSAYPSHGSPIRLTTKIYALGVYGVC